MSKPIPPTKPSEHPPWANVIPPIQAPAKRIFDTGATRDTEKGKLDFEGFLSPLVLIRYAEYLDSHRTMKDGSTRDSDNWQKGIPLNVYIKSLQRHYMDMWLVHRKWIPDTGMFMEDAMCGLMFNVMGYLHERLAKKLLESSADRTSRAIEDALGEQGYEKAGSRVVVPPKRP